jgi:hypothetical protein
VETSTWNEGYVFYLYCSVYHNLQPQNNFTEWLFTFTILACGYWPPLWPSGQSSWLQIQSSRFDSWCYQIFWEVGGLELGPLSLVSTIEELLERKSSSSSLEIRKYSCRDMLCWPHNTLYLQKLELISLTGCGRSVSVVHSRIIAMEFVCFCLWLLN